MEKNFTFKVKTYLGEELTISGSETGIIELKNMIADAAAFHKQNGRLYLGKTIHDFWEQFEFPEDEENE